MLGRQANQEAYSTETVSLAWGDIFANMRS